MPIQWGGGDNWKMRCSSNVDDKGRMWIAAWDVRSEGFKEKDDDMPINREATSLGPGTEWVNLGSISDLCLSRCAREHIQLLDISNAERQEVDMANLEKSAEILARIDSASARGENEIPQ